jgi:hypothetical protein
MVQNPFRHPGAAQFAPKTPVGQASSIPTIETIIVKAWWQYCLVFCGFAEDKMTLKKPQRPDILGRL